MSGLSGRRLHRVLVGLAALTLVQLGVSVFFALTTEQEHNLAIDLLGVGIIGLSFAGTGLFAWWRRPQTVVGALMFLTGFCWFFNVWTLSDWDPTFVLGFVLASSSYPFLIHLLLAFPDGRLETRLERRVVWGGYFVVFAMTAVAVPLVTPSEIGCDNCPDNPLLATENTDYYAVYGAIQSLIGAAVLIGLVVALRRRWRRWPLFRRRQFAPVLWAGGVSLTLLMLVLVADLAGVPEPVRQGLFFSSLIPFAFIPFAFLAGLLRSRLSRAEAVGELVAGLDSGSDQASLRDALAEALSDPSVELAYWVPETGGYVNANGVRMELPSPGDPRHSAEVSHNGKTVGAIVHDARLDDSEDLVAAVASAAGLRMENERLDAELRARLAELRASRARIVEAGYSERRRVERDLHDGAQQRLLALALNLKLARSRLDDDPAAAGELLDEATTELEQATAELRELARGLHPGLLTDRGLVPALEALASRAPVPVELEARIGSRPVPNVEAATYFLVSEALANVAKHADATRVSVTVASDNGDLTVEVADDGRGGADPAGSGLQGLADRVAAVDGRFSVSERESGGTVVRAAIPLD